MLKKGDTVVMHTCGEAEHYEGKIWVCAGDEFESSGGYNVVFLEGFSGHFMVKYLQKVNFDFSYQQFLADDKNYGDLVHEHADLRHFKEVALKHLTKEQLEEIEDEMENIPDSTY